MPLKTLKKNDQSEQGRTLISRAALEEEIAKQVKADEAGAALVGVILERLRGQSSLETNWTVRGIKFGTADRDKAGRVVEEVTQRLQKLYRLSNERND